MTREQRNDFVDLLREIAEDYVSPDRMVEIERNLDELCADEPFGDDSPFCDAT